MGCFQSVEEPPVKTEQPSRDATNNVIVATSNPDVVSVRTPMAVPITRNDVEITSRDKAMLKLKTHRDNLEDSLKRCEMMLQNDDDLIVSYIRQGRQDYAKMLYRRKKIAKEREQSAIAALNHVESMIDSVETQEQNIRFMNALEEGTKTLKSLNEIISIDKVKDTMDGFREEIDNTKEMQKVLFSAEEEESYDPAEFEREYAQALAAATEGKSAAADVEAGGTKTSASHEAVSGQSALESLKATPSMMPAVSGAEAATRVAARQTVDDRVKQNERRVAVGA